MERELEKIIELNGEKYRVRKMDVISGTYLLKFLMQKLMPIFSQMDEFFGEKKPTKKRGAKDAQDAQDAGEATFLAMIPKLLDEITEEDLHRLIVKCLNYADKSLPAGWQPVMVREEYGIKGIEYEMDTCLMLCYHCIAFNCGGFFDGGSSIFAKMGQITKLPTP